MQVIAVLNPKGSNRSRGNNDSDVQVSILYLERNWAIAYRYRSYVSGVPLQLCDNKNGSATGDVLYLHLRREPQQIVACIVPQPDQVKVSHYLTQTSPRR